MSDGGGHRSNGNGDDHLPYHLIGASAAEVHREALDVLNRLDSLEETLANRLDVQAESLLAVGADVQAARNEMVVVRAEVQRCTTSVGNQHMLLEGIERKLAAILEELKK